MNTDKIYLTGFMGAGSPHCTALARRPTGEEDVDTTSSNSSIVIGNIFARDGERTRALERRHRAVAAANAVVAMRRGHSRTAPSSWPWYCVWLDVAPEIVLGIGGRRRPLAADRAQLVRLFESRRAAYQQAHLRLDGSRARTEELVEQLMERLE